jgi:hypothetical protein
MHGFDANQLPWRTTRHTAGPSTVTAAERLQPMHGPEMLSAGGAEMGAH